MGKGQVYTYDFLIALTIVIIAVLISFKLVFNAVPDDDYKILELEGKVISSAIISEGSPQNWTIDNVIIPGILSQGRINITKLQQLGQLGYNNVSALLNTRQEFFIYFENRTQILNLSNCGFGSAIVNNDCQQPIFEAKNIAKLTRLTLINSTAIKMVILTWN